MSDTKAPATPAEFHPVQVSDFMKEHGDWRPMLPSAVTLRAYEVYRELWGEQRAMVEGSCRGGFGVGELLAMLYARSFPRQEWQQRFDEAIKRNRRE